MFLDDGSGPPVLLLASLRLAVTDHEKQSPWIGSFQLASSVLAPRSDGRQPNDLIAMAST